MKRAVIAAVAIGMLSGTMVRADWDNNFSFEVPYTNAWFSFDPGVTTNSSDVAFDGVMSLKFTTPDGPGDVPGTFTVVDQPFNAVTPGEALTASAYYYVPSTLKDFETLSIGLYWLKLNSGGTALEPSAFDVGGFTALDPFPGSETVGAWTPISVSGTAPADAEFAQVTLEVRGDGSTFYFDQVVVVPEPSTLALIGMGLAAVALGRRRRANR